jgi:hypothetical protein
MAYACHPGYDSKCKRKIMLQEGLGKKWNHNFQIIRVKRAEGVTQAVEYLLNKQEALNSYTVP